MFLTAAMGLSLVGAKQLQAQIIDLNGNGMSDIWELLFDASGLDPNADTDADGVINRDESIAGTNPFDSNSVPKIALLSYTSTNFTVGMPSALGKQYQLQSLQLLGGTSNWLTETSLVARSGSVVSLSAPANVSAKFFRLAISDVDTDGDGVSDWEEYQLGLDPTRASSSGQLDTNGQPLNDRAYVIGKLASQNVVTITATDPTANQPDGTNAAINLGLLTVTRGGFPLNAITVSNTLAGSGPGMAVENTDHAALPRSIYFPAGVSSVTIPVTPLANSNLLSPVVATLQLLPGPKYTLGQPSNASVLIYPSATAFGTGLTGQYFTNSSSTYSSNANFNPTNLVLTRVDPVIDFIWGPTNNVPDISNHLYSVRWTGQVLAQYSELYYFNTRANDGVKLWVNDQLIIDHWTASTSSNTTTSTGTIPLQGGTRYNIKLEYFNFGSNASCRLYWYSPSQSSNTIPASAFYPTNVPTAPTAITSSSYAMAFINQYFSFTNTAANSVISFTASGLPPGLSFNPLTGVISGTNTLAGTFQITLTASNAVGIGASVLNLTVYDTGSSVSREVWSGVPGTSVTNIPLTSPATSTNALGTLEGVTDYGDNYGERIRGYLTAPVTGNYYFWIAGSDSAELWISNDSESVNKVRRAWVVPTNNPAPPPANGTGSRQWYVQPTQRSPWLSLVAGQRYYIEILHKADVGTNDNWAVAWLQDPTGTNTTPKEVVPGYVLSRYFPLADLAPQFTPPPPQPMWTDDSASTNAAARFLIQATFGPTAGDIGYVNSNGYAGWISNQFTLAVTHHLPNVHTNISSDPNTPYPSSLAFNTWWQESVSAPDQLRQRVAFALSEILVVSEQGVLANSYADALSGYYDILLDNAFGNFRTLLKAVTLSPAMGWFLNMQGNDTNNIFTGVHANENYAREINQLFSVGLYRLWPDGTLVVNSQGQTVPTYDQNVVMGFASTFTGWNWWQANQTNGSWSPGANYTNPMVLVPTHHDRGAKLLLDNIVLPPAWGSQLTVGNTNWLNYGLQDLDKSHDVIFNNQSVGPYICRQLIQRLVTSNPSNDYLYRVVQVFNDNGSGVRGDMQAVIKAILLDYAARSPASSSDPTFGKQREPLLCVTAAARAFAPGPSVTGTYSQNGSRIITVNTAPTLHRLGTNDTVFLSFSDTSSNVPPTSQSYLVTITSPTTFTIYAPGSTNGTYGQTTNTITVTNSNHGLSVSNMVYLFFSSGGASNGVYQVVTVPGSSNFTVSASDSATRSGGCLFPRWTGGGFVQVATNITFSIAGNHGLTTNDSVYVVFPLNNNVPTGINGVYQVQAVLDATHFTIGVGTSLGQTVSGPTVYPLVATPGMLSASSGSVVIQESTWNMGATDSGNSPSLAQTPLRAPTVFNYFFPNYMFPGPLENAGLTTPEFQLTSDTTTLLQMNFLESGVLNNSGNTNGISSFISGGGALVLDLGPWMTPGYTANTAGVTSLVDGLSGLLTGGQMSAAAKTQIVNYVSNTNNFSISSPPTYTQMRDRVRGAVHLLINSPEYTIQK